MAWTKAKTAAVVGVSLLAVAGTIVVAKMLFVKTRVVKKSATGG
jgi:hypothetical protein